jgi:hypothetical protein
MTGDFSRDSYRAQNHYRSVRMQQGRVQLDADWNEQADIGTHRVDTEAADVIGPSGAPRSGAGFELAPIESERSGELVGDFSISAGHYYVNGRLCENDAPVSYLNQPDPPHLNLPIESGVHLVYLDVWERHLTALDDPNLREVALGGPDTATRMKLVWQVKLLKVPDDTQPGAPIPKWEALTSRRLGKLSARVDVASETPEPCLIEPGAGYRRLENQLYRVEIHPPPKPEDSDGELGTAVFKWSRNNGAILAEWTGPTTGPTNVLQVSSLGRDNALGFEAGDWVELFDDRCVLEGLPGTLVKLAHVAGQTLTLAGGQLVDRALFSGHPKVRGWNTPDDAGTLLVENPTASDGWIELEDGVHVKFGAGTYPGGNYWSIPARTAGGKLIGPYASEEAQPPLGILHHYAQLALVEFDGQAFTVLGDLRSFFPAVTELTSLFLLGGDGQRGPAGQELLVPLRVGVANGKWRVAGATVRFSVTDGGGMLNGTHSTLDVTSGTGAEEGIASCRWTLGTSALQQVTATLLDGAGNAQHLPVSFHATVGATDVDPIVRITTIALKDGRVLANDSEISPASLALGLQLFCDGALAPESVSRPTCSVAIELPWPLSASDIALWGGGIAGHVPMLLRGTPSVESLPNAPTTSAIVWTPRSETIDWLEHHLFAGVNVALHPLEARLLVWLTVQGNFIWSATDPSQLLDGDSFGQKSSTGSSSQTALQPIGDGRRGGTFKMWFWLVDLKVTIVLQATEVGPRGHATFTVDVAGAPLNTGIIVKASIGSVAAEDIPGQPGTWIYTAPARLPDLPDLPDGPFRLPTAMITATSAADSSCSATSKINLIGF